MRHLLVLCNDLGVWDSAAVLNNAVACIIALRTAAGASLPGNKDLFVLSCFVASIVPFASTASASTTTTLPLALPLTLLLSLPLSITLVLTLSLSLILVLILRFIGR